MSQNPRFTRARQLTSTVLPGRRPDDYPDQVTGRLRKLAAARSTGTLPFSGRSDGVVYFRDGKVAYAESNRTPGPAPHAYPEPAPDLPPLSRITAILAVTEPTVDAALELLSAQSRYARFRPSRVPDTGPASDISVEALLAEVARRQRVLKQLSTVLTAATALARNPQIHPESIRVSALQWSLLIRVRHGTTPRDLAWNLNRGVFGTTVEVHRLLVRRLLAAATLAVARRATLATECGTFREAVARGSDGYLAVYAAGDSAIVAVIGTSSLNVGMLQYRAREIIERIAAHSSQIGALAAPVATAGSESARPSRSLPRRRPATP